MTAPSLGLSRSFRILGLIPALLAFSPCISDAVVIAGESSSNTYDRFSSGYPSTPVENTNFFTDPGRLKGVGWNKANPTQSFALITPQHFIGANHFNPGNGGILQFFTQGGSVIDVVISSTATVKIGGSDTDVFIGELASPLNSADVQFFSFPSSAVAASLVGRPILPYGFTAQLGMNTVSSRDAISGASGALGGGSNLANTPTFEFDFIEGFEANGQARVETGDSGSPTFLEENGTLTIVGTHSALASSTALGVTTYISADADLTRMISEINTTIGTMGSTGYSVSQIPEPSVPTTVAFASALILFRRRRS